MTPHHNIVTAGRSYALHNLPRILHILQDICGQGLILRFNEADLETPAAFGKNLSWFLDTRNVRGPGEEPRHEPCLGRVRERARDQVEAVRGVERAQRPVPQGAPVRRVGPLRVVAGGPAFHRSSAGAGSPLRAADRRAVDLPRGGGAQVARARGERAAQGRGRVTLRSRAEKEQGGFRCCRS